jgi:hypothetical protein
MRAKTFAASSDEQTVHKKISGYRRRKSVGTLRQVGHPLSSLEGEKKEDASEPSELSSSLAPAALEERVVRAAIDAITLHEKLVNLHF